MTEYNRILKKIEERLRKDGPLSLEVMPERDNLRDWIIDYFHLNESYDTLSGTEVTTYAGADRSIGDVYRTAITKFPNLSFLDFAKTFWCKQFFEFEEVNPKRFETYKSVLVGHFCCDIHKRVYNLTYVADHENWALYNYNTQMEIDGPDENGFTIRDWVNIRNL